MIEDLFTWASGLFANTAFVFVQIKQPETAFSLPDALIPLASAALGGIIAMYASHRVSMQDIKHKNEDTQKKQAIDALSGQLKLVDWANVIHNIDNHITTSITEAQEDGVTADDPALLVGASIGIFLIPPRLNAEELWFLLDKDNTSLVNDIKILEQRCTNAYEILQKFSENRREFDKWSNSQAGLSVDKTARVGTVDIPATALPEAQIMIGDMNAMIGHLTEFCESEKTRSQRICEDYSKAARARWSNHFPQIRIGSVDADTAPQ